MKNQIQNGSRMCLLAVMCLALGAGLVNAKPPGKGGGKGGPPGHSQKGKGSPHGNKGPGKVEREFRKEIQKDDHKQPKWSGKHFRDKERSSVIDYFGKYRDNQAGLPPGLAKNLRRGKPLPPGWQKKVVPGYMIEDDHFRDFQPLAYDLFPGLPAVPNTRLYRYGNRVVRVYEPRREIIDVIQVPTIRLD